MKKFLISAVACVVAQTGGAFAGGQTLTVYTYDSFVSDWGPGPQIEAAFERSCACDLKFVAAGDGAAVLSRILLEGERTEADIVLGLDTNLTAAARKSGLFAPHGQEPKGLTLPIEWNDEYFLPYDWGYFAFVYDNTRLPEAPGSFKELVEEYPDLSIVIQDPRSSTPGLGLVLWMKMVHGDRAASAWSALDSKIVTVTKGWSEAYSMFLDGEADMVLSYTTSPAYHAIAEGDSSKKAAIFADGNYLQVEVAGKLTSTENGDLADKFLAFMLADEFQSIIPTTNWMYPAALDRNSLPQEFAELPVPEIALLYEDFEAEALRKDAIAEWRDALTR
ncbi:MAG: thiamine ABC transporter substrate binding subunit [Albidovulum sp.]|nr:thiamine ABC transporter substrate binding subunit [Albidovulum sp.]MDE0304468.1 thiamine ABC transporter substrate binding subunit [Albidovulum sp.]MDE0533392.1 thiamine ABC transporter substrate binding subunit [Albidovulum sp.]